jgi:hypothetical protein
MTWLDMMKIIHTSLKTLIVWYINLIWFDKGKDFDPLLPWFDLMKKNFNEDEDYSHEPEIFNHVIS